MRRGPHGLIVTAGVIYVLAAGGAGSTLRAQRAMHGPSAGTTTPASAPSALINEYCLSCHDDDHKKGGLALDVIEADAIDRHPDVWEKVVRKLRARQMPPIGEDRPDEATYDAAIASLEASLDRAATAHPNPGRTATLRRLTRTEYQNAIRDLLAIEIDATSLLPADESSYGFDNVNSGNLSPTLLDRYVSAAEKISHVAVGRPSRSPGGETIRIPAELTQEEHIEGLPIGTRGGALVHYTFPQDGEYDIQVRLMRDRDEHVEGLSEAHDVELLLDRARLALYTVKPPQRLADGEQPSHENVDQHVKMRVTVTAGPHDVGVAFPKKPSLLVETPRQPYETHFNYYRHPRIQPAIYSISIVGPYAASGPGNSPSRRRLFGSTPASAAQDDRAARTVLATLMRRAYRRPVTDADLQGPLALYRAARAPDNNEGFDAGIEAALSAVLVSPEFLLRVERDPAGIPAKTPYRIGDLELASRLSFFLWSSIPDDPLLKVATAGRLHEPAVLEQQVRRMLADPRAKALVTNFAAQWLRLSNLDSITPDMRLFPDFDNNLRQAFKTETELFFEAVLREDRSVLDLLNADYTFLNERLAKHYGIPHVYGSRFRRVTVDANSWRGGLLRHGSILTVTSYATRTSPVLRGKFVLDTLLGVPPPPPLPDVPALKDNTVDGRLSVRERIAEHRSNATCAPCHNLMDPLGLSLEKFDAVGRRRSVDGGAPIDAAGSLPDGRTFADVDGLEAALLARPELFVGTFAEKLQTYALGRGVDYYDAPAIRGIVRDARPGRYRISSIVLGIVKSPAFQMRQSR